VPDSVALVLLVVVGFVMLAVRWLAGLDDETAAELPEALQRARVWLNREPRV
jgi:hypothetical protein